MHVTSNGSNVSEIEGCDARMSERTWINTDQDKEPSCNEVRDKEMIGGLMGASATVLAAAKGFDAFIFISERSFPVRTSHFWPRYEEVKLPSDFERTDQDLSRHHLWCPA